MNKKAFTLVEMAIVLVIIGILAGITMSNLAGFGRKARDQRRISDLLKLSADLIAYYNAQGSFPAPSASHTLPTTPNFFNNYKDPINNGDYYYGTSSYSNEAALGACFESSDFAIEKSISIPCASTSIDINVCPSGRTLNCIRVRP